MAAGPKRRKRLLRAVPIPASLAGMSDRSLSPRPPLRLRPAASRDRDAIAALWHASASLPSVGLPAVPGLPAFRERLDVEWAAGWQVTLAVRGDDILGFLALKPAEAVLDQLFLRPDAIGEGIGTRLLDRARSRMPNGFSLHTMAANARARRFYERAGLRFLREDRHPRTGLPIARYAWKPPASLAPPPPPS